MSSASTIVVPSKPTGRRSVSMYGNAGKAAIVPVRTGESSATQVAELSPVLTGTIAAFPAFPYIDTDLRPVGFDGTTIVDADDIYFRNVMLMERFHIGRASCRER